MQVLLKTKRREARREARRECRREVRAAKKEKRVKDKELQRKRVHEAAARRDCKASALDLSRYLSGH